MLRRVLAARPIFSSPPPLAPGLISMSSTAACIYVRYGIPPGIESQLSRCNELAARLGLSVVREYQDLKSPFLSGQCRGYQEMLSGARHGDFGLIVVDDIKYLWRMQADYDQGPSELQALKLELVTVSGEDTRRLGWSLMVKKYVAEERDRKAAMQDAMGELANQIEVLKKKRA